MEPQKAELTETESRMVVARGRRLERWDMLVKGHTPAVMSKFWGPRYSVMTLVDNTVLYSWKSLRELIVKFFHHKNKSNVWVDGGVT